MQLLSTLEAYRLRLNEDWAGGVVRDVVSLSPEGLEGALANVTVADFLAAIRRRQIQGVTRRGRHLLISIRNGVNPYLWRVLQWTPGPSGAWVPYRERSKHALFSLVFEDGRRWAYDDPCRLGTFALWTYAEVVQNRAGRLAFLGPDWLDQPAEAAHAFLEYSGWTKRSIKAALLDQTVAAGVDNIVACEALWLARIHPASPATSLLRGERTRLIESTHMEVARISGAESTHSVYNRVSDWCLGPCRNSISSVRDTPPLTTRSFVCVQCQQMKESSI